MTLEDKIINFGKKQNAEKLRKEKEHKKKVNSLIQKIESYQDRVDYLLKLAKLCKENGITFISRSDKVRIKLKDSSPTFKSDSIYHNLGFNRNLTAIGFYNGGWEGTINTFVYETSENHPIEYNHDITYDIKHLEKWISQFEVFEKQFIEYIETL